MMAHLSLLGLDICFSVRTDHVLHRRIKESPMSKYMNLVQDPQAAAADVARWRKQHDARAYFLAIEAEIVEVAEAISGRGRIVGLDFHHGVTMILRERVPWLKVEERAGEVTLEWGNSSKVIANSDRNVNIPVPSNPDAYEKEAGEFVRSLIPNINALLS